MVSAISLSSVLPHQHELGGKTNPSFLGRIFNVNWDKTHLLANLIFVVSAVAYGFFNNLPPMILFSMGAYGLLTVILYAKAQGTRPSQSQIDSLQSRLDLALEKNKIFDKKLQGQKSGRALSQELKADIKADTQKLAAIKSEKTRLQRQIQSLRAQKKSLESTVGKLRHTR